VLEIEDLADVPLLLTRRDFNSRAPIARPAADFGASVP
jgi:hypothetical protein